MEQLDIQKVIDSFEESLESMDRIIKLFLKTLPNFYDACEHPIDADNSLETRRYYEVTFGDYENYHLNNKPIKFYLYFFRNEPPGIFSDAPRRWAFSIEISSAMFGYKGYVESDDFEHTYKKAINLLCKSFSLKSEFLMNFDNRDVIWEEEEYGLVHLPLIKRIVSYEKPSIEERVKEIDRIFSGFIGDGTFQELIGKKVRIILDEPVLDQKDTAFFGFINSIALTKSACSWGETDDDNNFINEHTLPTLITTVGKLETCDGIEWFFSENGTEDYIEADVFFFDD